MTWLRASNVLMPLLMGSLPHRLVLPVPRETDGQKNTQLVCKPIPLPTHLEKERRASLCSTWTVGGAAVNQNSTLE